MNLDQRISSFCTLGKILCAFTESPTGLNDDRNEPDRIHSEILNAMTQAEKENPWFTQPHILQAFLYWGTVLDQPTLEQWLAPYQPELEMSRKPTRVGVIMAGNIPVVGFHDLLCVLISGNHLIAKLSSQDARLIPTLVKLLESIDPEWKSLIELTTSEIGNPEAIIATGSNNASRYFSYYFGKYPHIIRHNRTGVAILDGQETSSELTGLASDIFSYFGLGCRNVSKLYLPEGYDLTQLHQALLRYQDFFHHSKYRNNLDYYKSIYLVNRVRFLDGVFYLLREEELLSTPVSVIHYEYYKHLSKVREKLEQSSDQIQCTVARDGLLSRTINPGETQHPGLSDYADNVDTLAFLLKKYHRNTDN